MSGWQVMMLLYGVEAMLIALAHLAGWRHADDNRTKLASADKERSVDSFRAETELMRAQKETYESQARIKRGY
jgi:hypothetical protein